MIYNLLILWRVAVSPAMSPALRKVLYGYDHPGAWTPGGVLPQQFPHRPALWRDGGVPGRPPQTDAGAAPPARAGGPDLPALSLLGPLLDRPILPPQRARVHRHAPGLDGYFPGSNAAEQPHRGGELYVAPGALNFSREQGPRRYPCQYHPTSVVAWGNPRA